MESHDYRDWSHDRRRQLVEGGFRFWVFRHDEIGCEGRHADLDGLALDPADDFWARFFPPLDKDCGCYVVGARTLAGIKRLGGNPDRDKPDWAR